MHKLTAPNGTRFEWTGSVVTMWKKHPWNDEILSFIVEVADLRAFVSEYDAVSQLKPPAAAEEPNG